MVYGYHVFGIIISVVGYILLAGGLLYFMYSISKSLKKIADNLEKRIKFIKD